MDDQYDAAIYSQQSDWLGDDEIVLVKIEIVREPDPNYEDEF